MQKVKIKSIRKLDKKNDRYDLTIDSTHNFFANNVLVHNTSARIANALVERKLNWFEKLLVKLGVKIQTHDYEFMIGTRNVILTEGKEDGFYSSDFRRKSAEPFKGKLHKNEEVFYEICGYSQLDSPIMGVVSTAKADKEVQKTYGKEMVYKYGCKNGDFCIQVYRIAYLNPDGVSVDLSWDDVKKRCVELGVNHVPEYNRFIYDGNVDTLKEYVASLVDGPSALDYSHIREGICLRVEGGLNPKIYKDKSYTFKLLEGIIKDSETYVDVEEVS